MMKKGLLAISILVALLAIGSQASADPIGPICDTCQGSIYTLSYSGTALPDADLLHETFRVTLSIDTSGYTGLGKFIDAVAIKVSPTPGTSATLFAAPGGVSNWALVPGGLNAGGCSGAGGGFNCADLIPATLPAAAVGPGSGILAWTFDVTMNNNLLFTDPFQASIKARYVTNIGCKKGALICKVGDLVSENITLQGPPSVPEPASLLLLGSGLAGIGLSQWKRRKAGQA